MFLLFILFIVHKHERKQEPKQLRWIPIVSLTNSQSVCLFDALHLELVQVKGHGCSSFMVLQVTLEKVLGITALGNSGLTCDPRSGLLAYPAG